MPVLSATLFRHRTIVLLASSLLTAPMIVASAHAQASVASGSTSAASQSHKSHRKGTANQPAPSEHQAVQPSSRLADEPNQVKEQVAPMPEAPVKPGSNHVAPGTDTPKPQLRR